MASQKRRNGVKQSSDVSDLRKGYDRVSNFTGDEALARKNVIRSGDGRLVTTNDKLIIHKDS